MVFIVSCLLSLLLEQCSYFIGEKVPRQGRFQSAERFASEPLKDKAQRIPPSRGGRCQV